MHYFPNLSFQFTQNLHIKNNDSHLYIYLQCLPISLYNRKKSLIISHSIPIRHKWRTAYVKTQSTSLSEATEALLQWIHEKPTEPIQEKKPILLSTHIEFWKEEKASLEILPLTLSTFKKNRFKSSLFIDILHLHPLKKAFFIILSIILNTLSRSRKILCCNSTYEFEFKLAQL